MKFRGIAGLTVAAAVLCGFPFGRASAQSSPVMLMSANSSGLTANVVGVAYNNGHVSVQIIIKNTNDMRVYLADARNDDSQNGFLGSGADLGAPSIDGLPSCGNTYFACSSDTNATAIDRFSYIDPGNTLGVAMVYTDFQAPSSPDTVSFSLTMMARFSKSTADNSPDDAGAVQEITLSFPFVSFSQKQ